jgi:hypothetical protein
MCTATLKFQGYSITCFKCPPSHWMHAASGCAVECCHCMHPIFFIYHWWLHLWPVWADVLLLVYRCHTLLTSCNPTERNLMGSSWVTKQATSVVCFFQSVFLQSVHLKILLAFCQNVEVLYHVIATLVSMMQEARPLYIEIIYFPEHFYKTELLTCSQ